MRGDVNAIHNPTITGSECMVVGWKSLESAISEPFTVTESFVAVGRIPVVLVTTPGKWTGGLGLGITHHRSSAFHKVTDRNSSFFNNVNFRGADSWCLWARFRCSSVEPGLTSTLNVGASFGNNCT